MEDQRHASTCRGKFRKQGWREKPGGMVSAATERAATLVMLQPPTPARESAAWRHAPSQPLMRPLLLQSQTPTASREAVVFFRSGCPAGCQTCYAAACSRRSVVARNRRCGRFGTGGATLASHVVAARPERPRPVGPHAAPHQALVATACGLSALSSVSHERRHLRQEPDAVAPLVRIPCRGS